MGDFDIYGVTALFHIYLWQILNWFDAKEQTTND